jgi:hypothetical protein
MAEDVKLEELTESVKKYINTNYELLKLQAAERTSVIGSASISMLAIGFIVILFVFFISIYIGFYLSTCLGDSYSGFAIVAGFYFLISLVLILGRKKLLENPLRDKIIRKLFSNNQ